MSPTVLRVKNYRFFFFSREEERIHVHVPCPEGEAKFWLEPEVGLAQNYGLKPQQAKEAEMIVKEHKNEITSAWKRHFAGGSS